VFSLRGGLEMAVSGGMLPLVLWQAVLATLRISVYLLIGALILQAVLSWVAAYSPISQPLSQLTRPFLDPIRRIVPPIAAIDLSPLIAILLAQLVLIFL
jgi:YggT family protein